MKPEIIEKKMEELKEKVILKLKSMPQKESVKLTGIAQCTLSQIANGRKKFSYEMYCFIAKSLKIT